MGSSLPPVTSSSPFAAAGDTSTRQLGAWFSDSSRRRLQPMECALANVMPIMASPPTTSLNKGSGVSAVAIANGGSGYAVGDRITLTGGTFSTAAVIGVTSVSSGAITGAFVRVPGVYQTNPTNPVSQGSTTGGGTGATFNLTFNAGVASTNDSGITWNRAVASANFRYTGYAPADVTSGYLGNSVGNGTAMLIEWESDEAHFDIRLVGNNSIYMLFIRVNGQWQRISSAGFSTDASGAPYILTVDWGGVYQPRSYKLVGVNTAFGGVITGSSGSVWVPPEPRRPLLLVFGDSYTYGTDASNPATTGCCIMGAALGFEVLANGIGGSGWNTSGANAALTRINNIITNLKVSTPSGTLVPLVPQYVQLDLGYNDAGGDMVALAANLTACIQALQSAWPQTKIYAKGPATPIGATTNLDTVRTTVMPIYAQFGIPFVDVRNWVNSTNSGRYTFSDNTHPNGDAGYEYLAGRTAAAVAAIL